MKKANCISMKHILLLGAAVLMLFASCNNKKQESKYTYETVKGDLTEARIYTLDNGLTVYLSVNNEEPRIQTYIAGALVLKMTLPRPQAWHTTLST